MRALDGLFGDDVYGPNGSIAWKAAQEAARDAGGDLSPLVDMHPFDREVRLRDLARSDIPVERALAIHQAVRAVMAAEPDPTMGGIEFWADAFVKLALPLPDAGWAVLKGTRCLLVYARRNGHVLVVRESGTCPGRHYPVVDGHHLSRRGGAETYANVLDAMVAAEAAAAHPVPTELERANG